MTDFKNIFDYYLIEEGPSTIACQDKNSHVLEHVKNQWINKPHYYVTDYLWGLDASEPEESPYRLAIIL